MSLCAGGAFWPNEPMLQNRNRSGAGRASHAPRPPRALLFPVIYRDGLCCTRSPCGTAAFLWVAIRIRRAVAALEANLVRTVRRRPLHEELGVEGDAAVRRRIELHHPAVDALGIEL